MRVPIGAVDHTGAARMLDARYGFFLRVDGLRQTFGRMTRVRPENLSRVKKATR